MIDSADDSQIQDSKAEFINMLNHNELRDALVLIFANKADMPTARSVDELSDIFGFSEVSTHEHKIQPCCALTGEGLDLGLDWLSERLTEKLKQGF